MKILIVEDWWADRLRFQYLLKPFTGKLHIDFAWSAGPPRGGCVWTIKRIVEAASQYDRIIIDLALNKEDEDRFRRAHSWSDEEFAKRERTLAKQITGLRLVSSLYATRGKHDLSNRCIIASAHVYDRLRDYCIKTWGIVDTFHKWSDEEHIIRTLYESKLRSISGE
jgi:hypothetical protein